MKRLAVAFGVFIVSLAVLMLPTLIGMYRDIENGKATGFAFVLGSSAENVYRLAVLLVLWMFAYWISGKLVRS
jgi:hypothetical protein